MKEMKICPSKRCNFASSCDNFCRKCGIALVEVFQLFPEAKTFVCPKCDAPCSSWDKFCGNCGADILATPLSELSLSVRSRKAMEKLCIQTIGELISRRGCDLFEAKNFGPTGVEEIRAKLGARFGLELRGE